MPIMTLEQINKHETRREVQRRLEKEGLAPECPECKEGPMVVQAIEINAHRFWNYRDFTPCKNATEIKNTTKTRIDELCLELDWKGKPGELFIP